MEGHQVDGRKELHIAPMLHYTDRHFRQLLRILSKRSVLWTEMVSQETVAHASNLDEHLAFDENTHPIVCQIGGSSPEGCGTAAQIVLQQYGYDECNLNMGCPSDKVSSNEFGAILMTKLDQSRSILQSMKDHSTSPSHDPKKNHNRKEPLISVKTRIGIDDCDDIEFLSHLIEQLKPACQRFILHARKCILGGLSARQNRSVPPLNYPRVYAICDRFPDCEFWINGGVDSLQAAKEIAYGSNKASTISTRKTNDNIIHIENNVEVRQEEEHRVPCGICTRMSSSPVSKSSQNGSCVAPPASVAPTNLKGVMIGRAAMDNPCMFWDADRYFYGEPTNPCQNRRQVLDQYCRYLETIYPRRCCDNDERITFEFPPPTVLHERDVCHICASLYQTTTTTTTPTEPSLSDPNATTTNTDDTINPKQNAPPKVKIRSRIIDRALRPVLNIFKDVPNTRSFKRMCNELGKDTRIRNCGPGYILRRAIQSVPPETLDQVFLKTDHLYPLCLPSKKKPSLVQNKDLDCFECKI